MKIPTAMLDAAETEWLNRSVLQHATPREHIYALLVAALEACDIRTESGKAFVDSPQHFVSRTALHSEITGRRACNRTTDTVLVHRMVIECPVYD